MVVNGWRLFAHPFFLDRFDRLIAAVERGRRNTFKLSANAKLLLGLGTLVFETIPQDPTRANYRQGAILGDARKHWFRAKFGGQRFRLFSRFSTRAKIIIYAWVNDETTLRTYGAKIDAYAVFRTMIDQERPPDDWTALLDEASQLPTPRSLDP